MQLFLRRFIALFHAAAVDDDMIYAFPRHQPSSWFYAYSASRFKRRSLLRRRADCRGNGFHIYSLLSPSTMLRLLLLATTHAIAPHPSLFMFLVGTPVHAKMTVS